MFKGKYLWFALLAPLVFIGAYFYSRHQKEPIRRLAYFGPKNALKVNDTTYHTIPPFFFSDQYGHKVTEQSVKGKIYVTDFFFTTCRSICPVMSSSLEKIYKQFGSRPDFMILSHTVDPETDSTAQLMAYAKLHGVRDDKWLFVTGDKKHLYGIARKGYMLNAEDGDGGPDDFIHTQNFALVDKARHIRGFYDGTDSLEMERLAVEIQLLLDEYAWKEKK